MNGTTTVRRSDLEERLRFESMLADLSSGLVNIEPAMVDEEIASRRGFELVEEILGASSGEDAGAEVG